MPVYAIDYRLLFPDPTKADPSGLLGIGGDLSAKRLILAYAMGIFPWYAEGEPIMWWSPDPRFILEPATVKISKSLRQTIRNTEYTVRFDTNFREVIDQCSKVPRTGQDGTWITHAMKEAYTHLHHEGFAHSVEIYQQNQLTGGLYGVSLGRAFFGESMFHTRSNASKIALYHLTEQLKSWDFHFIDTQVETDHLKSLGARAIPRSGFLNKLNEALKFPTKKGKW